jgi:hypothetical protein
LRENFREKTHLGTEMFDLIQAEALTRLQLSGIYEDEKAVFRDRNRYDGKIGRKKPFSVKQM